MDSKNDWSQSTLANKQIVEHIFLLFYLFYEHMCICMHLCMYIYVCVFIYIYIYIYIGCTETSVQSHFKSSLRVYSQKAEVAIMGI